MNQVFVDVATARWAGKHQLQRSWPKCSEISFSTVRDQLAPTGQFSSLDNSTDFLLSVNSLTPHPAVPCFYKKCRVAKVSPLIRTRFRCNQPSHCQGQCSDLLSSPLLRSQTHGVFGQRPARVTSQTPPMRFAVA